MTSLRTSFCLALPFFVALMLPPRAAAQNAVYADLYEFQCGLDPATGLPGLGPCLPQNPGILAQGIDGNLYGMACDFVNCQNASIFRMTPAGVITILKRFANGETGRAGGNPGNPSGLTLGPDGTFYGVTTLGGLNDLGTIFRITPDGIFTILHSFGTDSTDNTHGYWPIGPPVVGDDGYLYGTAINVGYKINTAGDDFQLLTTALPYAQVFTNQGSFAPLLLATDGNFYGTTPEANTNGGSDHGTVFRMTPDGAVSVIHNFIPDQNGNYPEGYFPWGDLAQGADGNLYGTNLKGGSFLTPCCGYEGGTAFQMTPSGSMGWVYSFPDNINAENGWYPQAGLVAANDGNLYGAASLYGCTPTECSGNGTLFSVSTGSSFTLLHTFTANCPAGTCYGARPYSTPMQATSGLLYGMTQYGGATYNQGVFYSLDTGLPPFVKTIQPSGKVGDTIGILGQGFSGISSVSFNGTVASFTVISDTYLTATVPSGATTGLVQVDGLTSNRNFRVLAGNLASTTTTITSSSPNPSSYRQTVTFAAAVATNSATPTGTVGVYDGLVLLCSAPLNAQGNGTCGTSSLTPGSHSITATYSGDSNFQPSTSSPPLSQVVNQASTSTSVISSLNPSVYLQSVTLTASLSSSGGIPTGTVTFYDGTTSIGTGILDGSGHASLTTSALTASGSPHSITASYGGDSNFVSNTSAAIQQTVNKANTITTLSSSSNPSKFRQTVTFTATVTPGAPTGTVQFFDGKKSLGTSSLNNGVATLLTSSLSKGTHSIKAVYGGSSNLNGGTSAVLSQVVK